MMMAYYCGKNCIKKLWIALFLIGLLFVFLYYSLIVHNVLEPASTMVQSDRASSQQNALIRSHTMATQVPHKRSVDKDNVQLHITSNVTGLNRNVTTASHVGDLHSRMPNITNASKMVQSDRASSQQNAHITSNVTGLHHNATTVNHVGDLHSRMPNITNVTRPASVRLLCWVMCDPSNLEGRVKHVKATWASRCDVTLYMSSKEDKNFPTIGLDVTAGRDHTASKAKAAWKYIYNNYFYKAEFFMKADPDTYVVVHNLKRYLANYDPNEPLLFGHRFNYPGSKTIYTSGGSGFVLSREAVRKLVTEALQFKVDCMPDGQFEDLKTGKCLQKVGVTAVDTRDASGRETFMVFPFNTHYYGKFPPWYRGYDMNGQLKGDQCCSHNPISFHYVKSEDMYFMDYALHKVAQAEERAETEFIFIKKAEERNQTKLV